MIGIMFEFMNITKALADENRIRILKALDGRELCVCQITDFLQLSPSTVSKHLSILRNARLVEGRKAGRWIFYRLADDSASALVTRALAWVLGALDDEPLITADRQRLETIIADSMPDQCRG